MASSWKLIEYRPVSFGFLASSATLTSQEGVQHILAERLQHFAEDSYVVLSYAVWARWRGFHERRLIGRPCWDARKRGTGLRLRQDGEGSCHAGWFVDTDQSHRI